jgi:hypothetical protein
MFWEEANSAGARTITSQARTSKTSTMIENPRRYGFNRFADGVVVRIGLNEQYCDLGWREISSWWDWGWLCGKRRRGTDGLDGRVLGGRALSGIGREGASGIADWHPHWATR